MALRPDIHQHHGASGAPHRLDCAFCRTIEFGPAIREEWAVLAEDLEFVAVPSVGALVPGWLLVLPREHALSMAALPRDEFARLERFSHDVASRVADEYGPAAMFEHGPADHGRPTGCGVDHAHMHVVPALGMDLLRATQQHFPRLAWTSISDLAPARAAVESGLDYLYLRTESGEQWLSVGVDMPSQAFRRVIAREQGRPHEFNWRSHPHMDVVRQTITRSLAVPA
jgi:ATP adenylyltransferase